MCMQHLLCARNTYYVPMFSHTESLDLHCEASITVSHLSSFLSSTNFFAQRALFTSFKTQLKYNFYETPSLATRTKPLLLRHPLSLPSLRVRVRHTVCQSIPASTRTAASPSSRSHSTWPAVRTD